MPLDRAFYASEDEAQDLIEEFGGKVCDNKIVIQTYVAGFLPILRKRCEALFVKLCRRLGSAL